MPKYKTKKVRTAIKRRRTAIKAVPRDKRMLMRWARRGTPKDYEKLHAHVARSLLKVPDWVDMDTVKKLGKAGQLGLNTMIKEHKPERPSDEQAQYHGGKVGEAVHKLTDALSWLVQEAGGGKNNPVPWLGNLPQYALKPFRGEAQTEVDEQYARLLSGGYNKKLGERPEQSLGWQRVPKWDTEYVSVWDNPDGHRFICVRGTNPTAKKDLLHDVNIARLGTTYDEVGPELQRILDDTEPSRIVDIAGHSLGTVLILQAYKNNKDLQSRIHMTRLYNPAYNPQLLAAGWMPRRQGLRAGPARALPHQPGRRCRPRRHGRRGAKNVVYRTPLGNHPVERDGRRPGPVPPAHAAPVAGALLGRPRRPQAAADAREHRAAPGARRRDAGHLPARGARVHWSVRARGPGLRHGFKGRGP